MLGTFKVEIHNQQLVDVFQKIMGEQEKVEKLQQNQFLSAYLNEIGDKIDKATFYYDVQLAMLNEYVEFMEADEDENGSYYRNALNLAKKILEQSN